MRMPDKHAVERLRREFPSGSLVELVKMDDPQAPPIGTVGEVLMVDDVATIHVKWRNGSGLGVAYGEDECRRID